MLRRSLNLLTRSPILMSIFPFGNDSNRFDLPVNPVKKFQITDELGWDRVKRIFLLTEAETLTKELQSIINITISGFSIAGALGGMSATRVSVDNFIANNEATRFPSHFDAKRHLQQSVFVNFLKKGGRLGARVGLFCFLFSTTTTCTTAYRGKLRVENYVFGGAISGLLYKTNLGVRAALVGAGVGSILGGICGSLTILILYFTGITMDEILTVQHEWILSRDDEMRAKIRTGTINEEYKYTKKLYDGNTQTNSMQKTSNVNDKDT